MVVTVKGTYTVNPLEETPKSVMYLSEFDHLAPITHAPLIYFYRQPTSSDMPLNQFERIKHSLSKVLSTFYPLAGRLRWATTSSTKRRFEINCNSTGVPLLEAESDSVVDDFGDFCPTAAVSQLLPPIDYEAVAIDQQPLLLVQFTRFGCGGVSLALRISHVLVDGTACSHFVSEWARISRGEELQNKPFLDRTVLLQPPESFPSPCPDHPDFKELPLMIGHDNDLEERRKETTPVMLKLSKDQIRVLTRKSNENSNIRRRRPFTTFEVVSAHMWRSACKARGHKTEQQTVLRVPVNFRNRVEPSLPKWYFGNAYVRVTATATAGELLAESLSHACGKIREAIGKVDDEYVKSSLAYIESVEDTASLSYSHVVGSEQGAFLGNPNMNSTSWLSLSLHGVDFGWGKDIYMGPGLIGCDGKSFTLPGRQEEGSVVVALRLQVAHMDAFKKLFYGDILRNKL